MQSVMCSAHLGLKTRTRYDLANGFYVWSIYGVYIGTTWGLYRDYIGGFHYSRHLQRNPNLKAYCMVSGSPLGAVTKPFNPRP